MLEKITQAILALIITGGSQVFSQAILPSQVNGTIAAPTCASYDYLEHLDHVQPGSLTMANQMMEQIQHLVENQVQAKGPTDLYTLPVVFHVVYNDVSENLADSVLENQLEMLNAAFRRRNSDTADTRSEFAPYVGDAGIAFKFADVDPDGNPSNGITRTYTDITHFGGVLPYGQGQNQQISDWVNDSLYYNFFRITHDSLGGKSAWDTDEYINVWIGDLRIDEPQFNFEEIVFFGLATPPLSHVNFPDSIIQEIQNYGHGALIHYVNIGSNNPNNFPAPYNVYNGIANGGKTLIHEIGHYLGLRHIWGDGDCSFDDYVNDTPLASVQSNFNCNFSVNSCVDDIGGVDLPNMVENYMDYSSAPCQNSFTKGQIVVMRTAIVQYRVDLAEVSSMLGTQEYNTENIRVFPNPSTGKFTLNFEDYLAVESVKISSVDGRVVMFTNDITSQSLLLDLQEVDGVYFIQVLNSDGGAQVVKLILQT